jgi:hypothetical protein
VPDDVEVTGSNCSRFEVELVGGEKILSYGIPLGETEGKYLNISIYGDPSNFSVLDTLVKSIAFGK